MISPLSPQIERNIARCRVILSVVALLAVHIDPTQAIFPSWRPRAGWFAIDPYTLATMSLHLCYSLAVYAAVTRRLVTPTSMVTLTTWSDLFFGGAIAFFTEGANSPFYAFFAFAVLEVGLRAGLRRTILVTMSGVGLYLSLIAISAPDDADFYIMRAVYLGITGYLVGYLGQQRLNLESEIHALGATEQRSRIARDLHDGWVQALAGVNLRIESCRELLRRGRVAEASAGLGELQAGVNREYDDLREYMRSLAGRNGDEAPLATRSHTSFAIDAEFGGQAELVEHVLQILREAISNVRRHAQAGSATLRVRSSGGMLTITIDDDGVGFRSADQRPWSISSRVRELGGALEVLPARAGAHLAITLPLG